MIFWIDGDSCPAQARDLVARTALRLGVKVKLLANRPIPTDPAHGVEMIVVSPGEGIADTQILDGSAPGDLVVTRDIPLAAKLVENGVLVLNDRGTVYTRENVRQRLSERDFMLGLRQSGFQNSGKGGYGPKEFKEFAQALDRESIRLFKAQEKK